MPLDDDGARKVNLELFFLCAIARLTEQNFLLKEYGEGKDDDKAAFTL